MFKQKRTPKPYDKENQKPIIRASICTGEQVAGLKDLTTGKFTELMVIRNRRDLDEFLQQYGISEDEIKKEW